MIRIGTHVRWSWGTGHGTGVVVERFTERVERTIKGSKIVRDASDDEPAFLIETDDGSRVLKSTSEVERAER